VAGNHELSFAWRTSDEIRSGLSPSVTYLQDSGMTVEGLRVYGTPWTGERRSPAYAFTLPYSQLDEVVWKRIPADTQILVTHSPPHDIMDGRIGCPDLRNAVLQRIRYIHCVSKRDPDIIDCNFGKD